MKHNNVKTYQFFVEKFKYANEELDLTGDTIAGSDPAI